jgi:membrane protein implicated in regulation of membrane protease activity
MGLDIRWPIGLMFTLIGAMLVVYGLATSGDPVYAQHSLGINVNLIWGLLLLVFGAIMLLLAWRGARKSAETQAHSPQNDPNKQFAGRH